ncbi:OLC1v1032428C1 [Oldenlandia corymbosa var. corymbosa]|uniref:OLC1v1032428C1 n=1 Tax=Oldenlandia corymbosa var. corymbosa TaxID=529605 RepID=A0AAV1CML4_OLDCO|nr:OLC1v1032428C1 [Oldenlandia corymbosa var. corymbosa]
MMGMDVCVCGRLAEDEKREKVDSIPFYDDEKDGYLYDRKEDRRQEKSGGRGKENPTKKTGGQGKESAAAREEKQWMKRKSMQQPKKLQSKKSAKELTIISDSMDFTFDASATAKVDHRYSIGGEFCRITALESLEYIFILPDGNIRAPRDYHGEDDADEWLTTTIFVPDYKFRRRIVLIGCSSGYSESLKIRINQLGELVTAPSEHYFSDVEENSETSSPLAVLVEEKPEMTMFRGKNPKSWILNCKNYFSAREILESWRFFLVEFHLDSAAVIWYREYKLAKGSLIWSDWDEFSEAFIERFDNQELNHSLLHLRNNHQLFFQILQNRKILVEESIDNSEVFDAVNCEKDDFRAKMFCDEFVPLSTVVDILVVRENMHSSAVVVSSANQKMVIQMVKCSFDADTSGHSVDKTELEKWLFVIDHGGLKGTLCNDDSPIVTNEFLRIKHSLVVDKVGHSVDKKKLEKWVFLFDLGELQCEVTVIDQLFGGILFLHNEDKVAFKREGRMELWINRSLVTCNECGGAIMVLERTSKRHVSGGAVVTCFRGSIIVEGTGKVFQHAGLLFVVAYWFALENARVATKLGKEATFESFWKLLNGLGTKLAGSDSDAGNVVSTFHLIVMMLPDENLNSLVLGSEFVRDSIVLIMPDLCSVLFSFLCLWHIFEDKYILSGRGSVHIQQLQRMQVVVNFIKNQMGLPVQVSPINISTIWNSVANGEESLEGCFRKWYQVVKLLISGCFGDLLLRMDNSKSTRFLINVKSPITLAMTLKSWIVVATSFKGGTHFYVGVAGSYESEFNANKTKDQFYLESSY